MKSRYWYYFKGYNYDIFAW